MLIHLDRLVAKPVSFLVASCPCRSPELRSRALLTVDEANAYGWAFVD